MDYDVAVLGAGPGGYEAAIRCAQYGLRTALIEARELGGTCLNRGCIPTKSLLHSAEVYAACREAATFGVDTENVTFDYTRMAARKDEVVSTLRKGIAGLEKAHGVTVVEGFGTLKPPHTLAVNGQTLTAENIILATGSAPARPPIPGIEGGMVLTSDEVLALTKLPESLVIIGGGVIGIEFATLYATLGCQVTVLEMLPGILPGVDAEILRLLTRTLKRKGISIVTSARVTAIRQGENVAVDYEKEGELHTATGSHCVVSVGRLPQTAGLGLEAAGITLDSRGFVEVDDCLRTSVPGIYAIGDITGKLQLAHVATAQGMAAAAACAGKPTPMRYDTVPACVYTTPELAWVGRVDGPETEVAIGRFNLAGNGKAMVMGENQGLVKLAASKRTGAILGAQILAPRATDLIAEVAAVMESEGTLEELSATIHPHPTVSEVVLEAAHDAEGLCCNAPPKRM